MTRQKPRTSLDFDQAAAELVGHEHARVDVQQSNALTVDGQLDLLVLLQHAEEQPIVLVVERQLEGVLAVGWKEMSDGSAAARSNGVPSTWSVCGRHLRHAVDLDVGAIARSPTANRLMVAAVLM